jgi:hypothetical protein
LKVSTHAHVWLDPFPPLPGAIRSSSLTMRKRFRFCSALGGGAFGSSRRGCMAEPPFDLGVVCATVKDAWAGI